MVSGGVESPARTQKILHHPRESHICANGHVHIGSTKHEYCRTAEPAGSGSISASGKGNFCWNQNLSSSHCICRDTQIMQPLYDPNNSLHHEGFAYLLCHSVHRTPACITNASDAFTLQQQPNSIQVGNMLPSSRVFGQLLLACSNKLFSRPCSSTQLDPVLR